MGIYQKGILIGLGSGMLWGFNNLFFAGGYARFSAAVMGIGDTKWLFTLIIPLIGAAANDGFAAFSLLIYNGIRGLLKQIFSGFRTKGGRVICAAALLGGPVGQLSYCMGIAMAGSMYALMITALYPIIGCLLSWIFLKQKISARMWIGVVLSVIGAILANYVPLYDPPERFYLGALCSGIAAFSWGAEIVLAVRGMEEIEPDVAITIREIVSGVILVATACFLVKDTALTWNILSQTTFVSAPFFLGAGVAAGLSYAMWYSANRLIGCAKGTATNSTFIVWGVLLNFLWGESPDVSETTLIGCALLLIGVGLVILNPMDFLKEEQNESQ